MKHIRTLQANELLELIFAYMAEVSSLRNFDDILMVLADMGRVLTYADRCSVWIVNEDKTKIWTKVAQGMKPVELPINSGIVGDAISNNKKIKLDDVYKDKRFNQDIDKKTGYKTKSMLVVPMSNHEGEIIGAFQVINNQSPKGVFDTKDMQFLMLASTYAAETIVSAQLTKEIEDTQREVVFTMGAVGESRSKETGNHVRRVAEYSKILALGVGMNEEEAEMLRQASPMHDIGKIAIADIILNKPGRFNADEIEIMKAHTRLGYEMLKHSKRKLLKMASIVAYEHHEKWDGTGYPRGLKGKEIHLYGRITALADVFDALGSDRVYKKAWEDERIFEFFKQQSGKHFDPQLVDVFFEHIDEILAIRDRFRDIYAKNDDLSFKPLDSLKILGAFGVKIKGFEATSIYIDEKNVIDAGGLINSLDEESVKIEHIWITHSHLDHISDIAYILDNYFSIRKKTLNIIALPQTIDVLKSHFFNDFVWPNFAKIPLKNSDKMSLSYTSIKPLEIYEISKNITIMPFENDHMDGSCGYVVSKNGNGVLISSDIYDLKWIVDFVNKNQYIKKMIIECSFPSDMEELALKSKHLTPKLLFEQLKLLKRDDVELFVNHIKPFYLKEIVQEIEHLERKIKTTILKDGDIVEF